MIYLTYNKKDKKQIKKILNKKYNDKVITKYLFTKNILIIDTNKIPKKIKELVSKY